MKVTLEIPLSKEDEKLVKDTVINNRSKLVAGIEAEVKARRYLRLISDSEARKGRSLNTREANLLYRWIAKVINDILLDYSVSFEDMKQVLDKHKK